MIKLAVFDMAGTTVADGDAVNRCLRDALGAAGLAVSRDEVNVFMGIPKPVAIRALIERAPGHQFLLNDVDAIFADFTRRMTRCYETDETISEVPGSGRLFSALRAADIRVALNTGFSRDVANTLLKRLNWRGDAAVDATICSDEVPRGRPFPDMIERLRAQFEITDRRHVGKIGDTPADLEEGTNAGCGLVVGVTWGTHTRAQLAAYPHTQIVDSLGDLEALLLA
jgi:phosphonatase-like hydrolase